MTNEFMLRLAAGMPEDLCLTEVENALKKYRANKTKENKNSLRAMLGVLQIKMHSMEESIDKICKDVEQIGKIHSRLNNNN